MTSRGETSGHTRRLRSGDLGMLMRTGYHRTMEYVQARLEQLGFDDVPAGPYSDLPEPGA